jgi:hypothetical protein
MKNTLELKFGSTLAGLGLTRKGYDVVTLSDDVLLVISRQADGAARRLVAQVIIHPCSTAEEAKAGVGFASVNAVADLPAYAFSFVSLDDNKEAAYVCKELAELLLFGTSDSVKLRIVD